MSNLKFIRWRKWNPDDDTDSRASPEIFYKMEKLTVQEIVRHKYKFSGDTHQNKNVLGVPEFEDENGARYLFQCSMRYWGKVMADSWNEIEQAFKYDYMDFYVDGWPDEMKDMKTPE